MRKISKLSLLVLLVALSSCATVKVVSNKDKEVDFTKYKTYSFLGWEANSDKVLSQIDKDRFHQAFGKELERRGLKRVKQNGDMMISLFIVFDDKTAVSAYNNYYGGAHGGMYGGGYSRYSYGWGYGYSSTRYTQQDYNVGTLVMDVFDRGSKKQVWQGVATKTVNENIDKREKSIPRTVESLMRRFPVTP